MPDTTASTLREQLLKDVVQAHAQVAFKGGAVARYFELVEEGNEAFADRLSDAALALSRDGIDPCAIDNDILDARFPADEWKAHLKPELVYLANTARAAAEERARAAPSI